MSELEKNELEKNEIENNEAEQPKQSESKPDSKKSKKNKKGKKGKQSKNKKKKLSKPAKMIIGIIEVLILLLLIIGFLVGRYLNKMNYSEGSTSGVSEEELMQEYLEEEESTGENASEEDIAKADAHLEEVQDEDPLYDKNVFNILLIGCDARSKGGAGRSDAMILVSLNKEKENIYMTSFMRDMYVSIPGYKNNNRMNAAYAFGGAPLLLKTLEQNFGIKVDKYAAVDFYSFQEIVDVLGGIEMELKQEELKFISGDVKAGVNHLNGKQALEYSRIRYVGDADFERTQRQRRILEEVFETAQYSDIRTMDKMLNTILPMVSTNLTQTEILSLMMKLPTLLNYELVPMRIPIDGTHTGMKVRGMSVLQVDLLENQKYLQEQIY